MTSKRVVQDIVPSDKKIRRSTRSTLPIRRTTKKNEPEIDVVEKINEEIPVIIKKRSNYSNSHFDEITKQPSKTYFKSKYSKLITFSIVFVCISIIAIALSLLYTKAVVTITPVSIPINIDGNFIAKKDSNNADILGYQVVTANIDEYKTVPASDGSLVQTKAKGTITLFNNYSSTTQKILAGTKISSDKNLIYKTTWTVVIPGKKTIGGKVLLGTVDVGIVADQAGANYNIPMSEYATDFRIVAYKGSPKYQTFYGRIKKDIVGGFSGKKKIISTDVEKTANTDLENTIKEKLLKNISSTLTNGLVLFDNAYNIEYQKLPQIDSDPGTAKIGVRGNIYAVVFNSKSLIEFITKKQIEDSHLQSYKVDGLTALKFNIINEKDLPAKKGIPLSFNLHGPIKITGIFSEGELKKKLVGIKLDKMNPIITQYPSIKNVSVLLTPFWMRSFPNSTDNIIIEYK